MIAPRRRSTDTSRRLVPSGLIKWWIAGAIFSVVVNLALLAGAVWVVVSILKYMGVIA